MGRQFGAIRKLPSGNFQASYVAPGIGRVTAPITFARRDQADTWLAAQRVDLARETWKAPSVGSISLRLYAVPWLSQRTNLKPRTADLYQRLLNLHVLPELGDRPLKGLTPAVVRAWHSDLGSTTGPTAQAQSYRLLRTILNQAVRDGEIPSNPCQIVGAGSTHTAERPAPTLTQVHQLADLVPARYQALVLVAAYGGLRFGELTALTRADVVLREDRLPVLRVRKSMSRLDGKWLVGSPKSDAGMRNVALPTFLGPILTEHLANHVRAGDAALVFATRSGRPLHNANWTSTFKRAKTQIGLDDCHFHDLRHAAATAAVQSGATLKDTMARLGHASPRAAMIYQHTAPDRDEGIAHALDVVARGAQQGKAIPLNQEAGSQPGSEASAG